MAARFNALIVPFGAVGCEDSFEFIADSLEQARIPILGPALRRRAAKNIPQARRSACQLPGDSCPAGQVLRARLHLPPASAMHSTANCSGECGLSRQSASCSRPLKQAACCAYQRPASD